MEVSLGHGLNSPGLELGPSGCMDHTLAARLICDIKVSMARQSVISKKKRGPAPTGKGEPVLVRLQPHRLRTLDAWRERQEDEPSRPEAIRRLVEMGLAAAPRTAPSSKRAAATARKMARATIDQTVRQVRAAGGNRRAQASGCSRARRSFGKCRSDVAKVKV